MKPLPVNIGEIIREKRDKLGMSRKQLGELAHVPVSTLGAIETGRRAAKREMLEVIASALKVTAKGLISAASRRLKKAA